MVAGAFEGDPLISAREKEIPAAVFSGEQLDALENLCLDRLKDELHGDGYAQPIAAALLEAAAPTSGRRWPNPDSEKFERRATRALKLLKRIDSFQSKQKKETSYACEETKMVLWRALLIGWYRSVSEEKQTQFAKGLLGLKIFEDYGGNENKAFREVLHEFRQNLQHYLASEKVAQLLALAEGGSNLVLIRFMARELAATATCAEIQEWGKQLKVS